MERDDNYSGPFRTLSAFCAESLRSYQYDPDQVIAYMLGFRDVSNPDFFVLRGFPICYKYRIFESEYMSYVKKELPSITVPFEDCSDCAIGYVKKDDGTCGCPEGMLNPTIPGGCVRNI